VTWVKLALAAFNFLCLAGKALFGFAIYRAGESAQASKDQAATIKEATDAQGSRDRVDTDPAYADKLRRKYTSDG
jgi:hypothetical protein